MAAATGGAGGGGGRTTAVGGASGGGGAKAAAGLQGDSTKGGSAKKQELVVQSEMHPNPYSGDEFAVKVHTGPISSEVRSSASFQPVPSASPPPNLAL